MSRRQHTLCLNTFCCCFGMVEAHCYVNLASEREKKTCGLVNFVGICSEWRDFWIEHQIEISTQKLSQQLRQSSFTMQSASSFEITQPNPDRRPSSALTKPKFVTETNMRMSRIILPSEIEASSPYLRVGTCIIVLWNFLQYCSSHPLFFIPGELLKWMDVVTCLSAEKHSGYVLSTCAFRNAQCRYNRPAFNRRLLIPVSHRLFIYSVFSLSEHWY